MAVPHHRPEPSVPSARHRAAAPGATTARGPDAVRRFLAAAALTALAACGFAPVYGPGGSAEGLRGQIRAEAPDNRNAFTFVSQFEQRLGRAQAAPYRLGYTIATVEESLGITPAQETTRYNVTGTVSWTLADQATGAVLATGDARNFTGYSATSLIVGTESSQRDAYERLMRALADQVVTRLIATAPDWRR